MRRDDLETVDIDKKIRRAIQGYFGKIKPTGEDGFLNLILFHEQIVENLPCGVIGINDKGRIDYANDSAEIILGHSDGLLLKNAGELLSAELFREVEKPVSRQIAVRDKSRQGGEVRLNCLVIPGAFFGDGEFKHVVVFTREIDVEDFKAKLTQSNRMAGIGTLARGVAHEFNNLIGGMLGYAQLAQKTDELADYRKCNEILFEAGNRAQEIIGNLLAFARREPEKVESISLRNLVEEVVSLIERELKKNDVEVTIDIPHDCIIKTDLAEFQQVLLNLFINAMHAMMEKSGGRLSISARSLAGNIQLEVQDTGVGIDKEAIHQIFDPFYTTKGSIGTGSMTGSGLGLSVCYGIVKKLGGDIAVSSSIGQGSIFHVTLPSQNVDPVARVEEENDCPEEMDSVDVSAKILVIDDEAIIRNLLNEVLVKEGYEVRLESNGFAAVERARHFEPDIAIIDAQMPGMSGMETFRELARENKTMKFLLITGKTGEEFDDFAKEAEDCGVKVIRKPFTLENIRGNVLKLVVAHRKEAAKLSS